MSYNAIVWINYELNIEEITELFCINKEKPVLQCHGKCHIKRELIQFDVLPDASDAPVQEASYIPDLTQFVIKGNIESPNGWRNFSDVNLLDFSYCFWLSNIPDPPFTPPRLIV